MADEPLMHEEPQDRYEPPAVVELGSFTELTLDAPQNSLSPPP